MCSEISPSTSVKLRSAIWRMFRNTADEDYIVARWCALANKPYQFYWNGAQTLEKYLKCSLLLNGVKVSNFGHDIHDLYEAILQVAGDVLPYLFIPPFGISLKRRSPYRASESYSEIVKRFANQGDPSNRYRTASVISDSLDLMKLDELCFQFRRLCFPLHLAYGSTGNSYREILRSDASFQPHLPLHSIRRIKTEADKEAERIARAMNFSYFPDDAYKGGKYPTGVAAENAELFLTISEPDPESQSVVSWLLAHCYFPRSIKDELNSWLKDCRRAL